jgi:hypothetical protein
MVAGAHRLCLQRGLAGPNDFVQALDFALEILRLRHLGRSHKCSRSHSRAPRDYALASPLHQAPPSSLSSASQPDSLARSLCNRLHKFSDPALRGGARWGLPRIAIVRRSLADVRFSPDSDQAADIPKGPICANSGSELRSVDFCLIATIGIILLIGIVKENGIVVVDFGCRCRRR